MKKITKIVPVALAFVAVVLLLLSSCDKMDDIQRKYAEKEEQVYLGKVDSIRYFSGFGRAKITWYIGSDPKVEKTIIYWNMRKDSIVKEFVRKGPGAQKDSVIVENLPEGSTLFEFRNINNRGETSLYSSSTVTVWGSEFAVGLRARKLTAFNFDYAQSLFTLNLSPSARGDSVIYSEIVYKDKVGAEKTVRIERATEEVQLPNFPDAGEFKFRTVFFPPQGLDIVYNEFKTYRAPDAISNRGVKLSVTGRMASKYFTGEGQSIYEWNATGGIIRYAVNADGSLTQTASMASLVPRATYRDFFYYDEDRFIGINTAGAVSMHQIQNGQLIFVKATPTSANTFGTGFTMPRFVPGKGFFFSVLAASADVLTSGEVKAWYAKNDATFGAPNGVTVGKGYAIYEPLTMFNNQFLLGVDTNGNLWSIPVTANGALGYRSRIGTGWNRFKKIVGVGTSLLCMEENGSFYVFNNFNSTDKYWIVN